MTDVVIYDVVPRAGVIDLGKQVEGLVTRVVLPNIRRGAGTVQLVHQRSDDQKPYPVPITEDGESVYWLVSRADTAFPGRGQAELQWFGENGAVAKSVTYQTNTTRSMAEPGPEPDEPLKPYTQAVARDAQAAKDAAASATEAARSAEASAGQAGLSAATATEAAKNAEAIVGQAGQSAQSAQAAALAAAQNAAAAETAEDGAKQAQTGADAAKTAAEKAAQEAKTAQTGAVEAKTGAETAQAKAEEAAQGVAADREQIRANTAGLEAATQDVTVLKAENTALKASTARTARSLDYLWKKSKGIVYDTETVTGAGSSVTVPSGAMDYATLRKVGGMSRKGRNLLRDVVTTIMSSGGVTSTPIRRGEFVVMGKTTDVTYIRLGRYAFRPGETYRLTGFRDNGIKNKYALFVESSELVYPNDIGNGVTFVAAKATTANISIIIPPDYAINITVKPMITTDITATYADFEPYADALLDAPVDAVRVANAAGDNTNTYPIPQAIRDLCPDYGIGVSADCYNYIDFAAKQYHHRVGQVDLGTLDWIFTTSGVSGSFRLSCGLPNAAPAKSNSSVDPLLCPIYKAISSDNVWYNSKAGLTLSVRQGVLIAFDPSYSDGTPDNLAAFVQHVTGVPVYYELATPEIIDLSAVWPDDDFGVLRVEAGGTIGLHYPALDDGYELAVPSETEIMVDVAKVVQTNG